MNPSSLDLTPIIERASRDPRYRAQLLAEPRVTLQRDLGSTIRDEIDVFVVEESPSHIYVVIPHDLSLSPQEEDAAGRIVRRAAQDPAYRERLLADPRGLISEEMELTLPEEVEVTVLQDAPNCLNVILPAPFESDGKPGEGAFLGTIGWGCSTGQLCEETGDACDAERSKVGICTMHCSELPCDPLEDQPPTSPPIVNP